MTTTTCHWHPDRETGLRCSRCGKPICTECMRQHPVGVRCKECAREMRLPTYQISRAYYTKGIAAAIGLGLAGLVLLTLLFALVPFLGFFFFIVMGGLGYAIGEGVGKAVNQRRGRPYQYMALTGVLLATAPIGLAGLFALNVGALLNLGGVAIAAFVAWGRRAI